MIGTGLRLLTIPLCLTFVVACSDDKKEKQEETFPDNTCSGDTLMQYCDTDGACNKDAVAIDCTPYACNPLVGACFAGACTEATTCAANAVCGTNDVCLFPPEISEIASDVDCSAAGETVTFTSQVVGEVTSYAWDFGDNGTSTNANPTHTYAEAGDYEVTLTILGPGGEDEASLTEAVHIATKGWQRLHPAHHIGTVNATWMSPSGKLYAVTDFGEVATHQAGTWQVKHVSPYRFTHITGLDQHIIAADIRGFVWRTTDGGTTWEDADPDRNLPTSSFHNFDPWAVFHVLSATEAIVVPNSDTNRVFHFDAAAPATERWVEIIDLDTALYGYINCVVRADVDDLIVLTGIRAWRGAAEAGSLRNGAHWTELSGPAALLYGCAQSSPTKVWAYYETDLRRIDFDADYTTYAVASYAVTLPADDTLGSITTTANPAAPGTVWATSYRMGDSPGAMVRVNDANGASPTLVPVEDSTLTYQTLGHAAAFDDNHVWLAADLGYLAFFDGASWSVEGAQAPGRIGQGATTASGTVWFPVVSNARPSVVRRTADEWTSWDLSSLIGPGYVYPTNVWAASDDDVWAGGLFHQLLHFDGSTWETVAAAQPLDPSASLNWIWGSGANDVWAVGHEIVADLYEPVVLHRMAAGTWDRVPEAEAFLAGSVEQVFGTGPDDVFIVSPDAAALVHWDGLVWEQSVFGISDPPAVLSPWIGRCIPSGHADFAAVQTACSGSGAAPHLGSILPTGEIYASLHTGPYYFAASASCPDDGWVCSLSAHAQSPSIPIRFDGSSWAEMAYPGITARHGHVFAHDEQHIYTTDLSEPSYNRATSTIGFCDGETWSVMQDQPLITETILGFWGDDTGGVYARGLSSGALLYHEHCQ